jgi:hypothetical protein
MKIKIYPWIILIGLAIILASCQAVKETESPGLPDEEAILPTLPEQDQAYPIETVEPFFPEEELAYPITEEDLGMLLTTWDLSTYFVDGSEQPAPLKTIQFNADNTFTIDTEQNTITGTWSAQLYAIESNLTLRTPDETFIYYQIITLDETQLILSTILDGKLIEEHYTSGN